MNNPFDIIDARLSNIETLLLDLKRAETSANLSDEEAVLTVKQASKFLHLSVPTLYAFCQSRQIPFSKRGKRLYFSKSELLSWVSQGRRKTASEIKKEIEESSPLKRKDGKL